MRSSLTHRSPSIIAALITTSTALAHAAPNYDDHILPIFEQSCNNCHNPDKQKGDLDLTTYTALMRGGSGGKIAEPGEGADSKLYGVITHTLKPKMPPKGEKLSKKDADTIRAWIDGGLLENKSGKPKKKKKAAFSLPSGTGSAKPDGPPPLPRHALLEPVVHTPRASAVADMAASPWAPLLAVTGQRQVLLYHTDTLQLIGIFPFPAGQPETLSFHPSGKYLLAGGGIGGKSGTTITWEVETGKIILTAGKDFDSCIAASLRSDLGGVSFGGPGKRVKLWDTSSDEQLLSIKKHTDWVTQLKYSPDGVLLASGGRGSGVYIWEAETGNPFHTLRAHQGSITEMAWRSDSNLLATASEDGSVLVWEMNNGKQVKKITAHGGGVLSLDWNKNGKGPGGGHLVTSGRDGRVKLWKPNFSLLKELPKFPAMITEVALSQDGKRVFAADWSGAITVWDVATAKQIGTLAANPPTIAQRIEWTRKEIATAPAKLNKAQATAKAAAAQMTAAKTAKETTEKEYHKCKSSSAKLLADRTRLDAQLKTLNAQGQELQKRRIPIQAALTQAREALKKHTAAIRSTEQQKRQTENEIKQLTAKEKQLAERVKKTSEEAAKKPEDPALQQAATQAKQAHTNHLGNLNNKKKLLDTSIAALAKLTNEQQTPGNKLAAADKAMKDWVTQSQALQAKRKPLQEQRNGIIKSIADTNQQLQIHTKNLKPHREAFAKADAHFKTTQAALDHAKSHEANLKKSLIHWQAAAINTDAIRLEKEASALNSKQSNAMDTFTELSRQIQQLKDPSKLKELSRELAAIRKQIDQAAPNVLEKSNHAASRKAAYHKALAQ